jgi:hypothetical protein
MTAIGPIERIGQGQFLWLATIGVVAGGVYVWPQVALATAGGNWPWVTLADTAFALALAAGRLAAAAHTRGPTHFERLRDAWGVVGWAWYAGDAAAALAIDAMVLALFAQMLQTFFYPAVASWVLRAALAGIAAWFSLQSLVTLARNVQVWLVFTFLSFYLLAVIALPHVRMAAALLPVWPPDPAATAGGVGATAFLWLAADVPTSLGPWVRGAGWRALWRLTAGAYLYQGLMLALVAATSLTILGPWATSTLEWPMIYLFAGLGPASLAFARPSLIILPMWSATFLLHLAVHQYVHVLNLQSALGLGARARALPCALATTALLALAAAMPASPALLTLLSRDVSPLVAAWFVAETALTLVLVRLRRLPTRPVLSGTDAA